MKDRFKRDPGEQNFTIRDLLDIQAWQKVQDNFSAVTDVGIRTVDPEGNQLTLPSSEPRLCSQLLRGSPLKDKVCGLCLPTFLGGLGVVDKNLKMFCNVGLCNFIAPLRINRYKALGYIIVGPLILVMRKSKEEYLKVAEELSLDLEDFWNVLLEIRVISINGAQAIVELIKDVGEGVLKLAYKSIAKEREEMKLDLSKISKLLDALLDVAFQVSGADIGSIMFFDKDRNELTIRTSRGIPEEIVSKTRVKLGDGISGLAVKEGQSLLIDNNIRDNRIRPYLTRPYISSSMVLPIKVEESILGVMNLGALQTSAVNFNIENMKLMNKLIDLVTVALRI